MTTRREVLQGLIISLGGAAALTACGGVANIAATRPGAARFYSEQELALVSRISDLVIPRTETPGALDVNVPGYIDALMADWASEETRNNHRSALQTIASQLNSASGGDFAAATESNAERALRALDSQAFSSNGRDLGGYRRLKAYISQSYFASEEGALQELKWVAVPGRWDPSVEIAGAD